MLISLLKSKMTDFVIKKLHYDLSSHAGLAFVGKYLKRVNVNALIDPMFSVRSGVANSEILKSYLALLCLGKSDFDATRCARIRRLFTSTTAVRYTKPRAMRM
jgi:hypothetical protein